ncbi:hypothetical protein GVN18_41095, partial [Pseudomonas sp. ODNR1LW]|nr:hypothetical protein [Pseudomonas sp. ODNR1LW]
ASLEASLDPVEAVLGSDVDLDVGLDVEVIGLEPTEATGGSLLASQPDDTFITDVTSSPALSDLDSGLDLFESLGDLPTSDITLSQFLGSDDSAPEATPSLDIFDMSAPVELASSSVLASAMDVSLASTSTTVDATTNLVSTALADTATAPVTASVASVTSALKTFGARLF